MANNDFFLTGGEVPNVPAIQQFGDTDFSGRSTNMPLPADITPQVTDIFRPQETLTPTQEWLRGKETPSMQASRAQQQNQDAISNFMQTPSQIPPPVTEPTSPIPLAQPQMPSTEPIRGGTFDTRPGAQEARNAQTERAAIQAGKVDVAKSRIGARAAIKSLEEQGMSRDDIKKQLNEKELSSPQELLVGLQRMQKKRDNIRAGTGVESKVRDRITQDSVFAEDGTPTNPPARAQQYIDFNDDFGPDPQSEKSNYDYMKPSERNQINRTIKDMSRGSKNKDAEKKLKRTQEVVEKRRERDYLKKQADLEQDALTLASKRAETAEDKATQSAMNSQVSRWKDELGVLDDVYKKANRDRKKQIQTRRTEISTAITEFNEGAEVAGQPTSSESIINTLMTANPNMTEEDANKYAKSQGYIK